MNDRLQQLALFVRVVESGSFSKVAREFGLSQPSVSRSIAALERRLGGQAACPHHPASLATDAGEALLGRARDALLAIDEAESAAARRRPSLGRAPRRLAAGIRRPAHRAAASGVFRAPPAAQDRPHDVGPVRESDRRRRRPCAPDWRPAGSSFVARKLESARRLFSPRRPISPAGAHPRASPTSPGMTSSAVRPTPATRPGSRAATDGSSARR